jgi:hypothetical protein
MNLFILIILFLLLVYVFIYTLSFGIWVWKAKNKFGALMVIILAFTALLLPVYSVFFRY